MKKLVMSAAIGAALLSTGVSAANLDFVAYANAQEKGVVNGTVIAFDGLNVTFNAFKTTNAGQADAFAYFDGDNGGLGVCKVLTNSAQCNPSDDDNVTAGETLTISFDVAQTLKNIVFHAEGHTPTLSTQTMLFGINGGALASFTFDAVEAATYENVLSMTFKFGGTNADQFYLATATANPTPVPVPAALPLLLSAMGVVGAASRRRNQAA